jgi:hypothetical protein
LTDAKTIIIAEAITISGNTAEGSSVLALFFKTDLSDKRVICQTGIIIGSVILIIGLLMLTASLSASGYENGMIFSVTGGVTMTLSVFAIRRIKSGAFENDKVVERKEWERYTAISIVFLVISITLIMLDISIPFAIGFPLAIVSTYVFWSYVLNKTK